MRLTFKQILQKGYVFQAISGLLLVLLDYVIKLRGQVHSTFFPGGPWRATLPENITFLKINKKYAIDTFMSKNI